MFLMLLQKDCETTLFMFFQNTLYLKTGKNEVECINIKIG